MRTAVIASLTILALVGCGSPSTTESTTAPTQTGKTEVSMTNPTEEQSGKTTLGEASKAAGIEAYPGFADAEGKIMKRSDGAEKDEITFTTPDSLEKVNEFYKKQGFDAKINGTEASAMGQTKTNAQVIIAMKSVDGKVEVSLKSLRYPTK